MNRSEAIVNFLQAWGKSATVREIRDNSAHLLAHPVSLSNLSDRCGVLWSKKVLDRKPRYGKKGREFEYTLRKDFKMPKTPKLPKDPEQPKAPKLFTPTTARKPLDPAHDRFTVTEYKPDQAEFDRLKEEARNWERRTKTLAVMINALLRDTGIVVH
jgi:hypothetical protein